MNPRTPILAAGLCLAGTVLPSLGQSAEVLPQTPADMQKLIETLKRENESMKKEIEAQNTRLANIEKMLAAQAQAPAVAAAPSTSAPATVAGVPSVPASDASKATDSGIKLPEITSSPIVKKITLTGSVQPQIDSLNTDLSGNLTFPAGTSPDSNHIFVRRLVVGAKVDIGNGFTGQLIANMANNPSSSATSDQRDLDIERAVMEYNWNDQTFAAGLDKAPFGVLETTSANDLKTVERSAADRYFVEGGTGLQLGSYHSGVFAKGKLGSGFSYSAMIGNPEKGEDDFSSGGTNQPAYVFRLDHTFQDGDLKWVNGVDLAAQPGITLTNSLNKATYGSKDVYGAGLHSQMTYKRFGLFAELLAASVEGGDFSPSKLGEDANPIGWTITPSYFLIKDRLELVTSWSHISSDGMGINLGQVVRRAATPDQNFDQLDSVFLGLGWYIKGTNLKITGGYEWAKATDAFNATSDVDGEATVNGFRIRGQMSF